VKIHVATYATVSDLEDLRDSVRDADLEFIVSYPTTCARTRSDVLDGALESMRNEYAACVDHDEEPDAPEPDQLRVQPDPSNDPELAATYNVNLSGKFYGIIRVNVFDI
jgi:hypothetical protein